MFIFKSLFTNTSFKILFETFKENYLKDKRIIGECKLTQVKELYKTTILNSMYGVDDIEGKESGDPYNTLVQFLNDLNVSDFVHIISTRRKYGDISQDNKIFTQTPTPYNGYLIFNMGQIPLNNAEIYKKKRIDITYPDGKTIKYRLIGIAYNCQNIHATSSFCNTAVCVGNPVEHIFYDTEVNEYNKFTFYEYDFGNKMLSNGVRFISKTGMCEQNSINVIYMVYEEDNYHEKLETQIISFSNTLLQPPPLQPPLSQLGGYIKKLEKYIKMNDNINKLSKHQNFQIGGSIKKYYNHKIKKYLHKIKKMNK